MKKLIYIILFNLTVFAVGFDGFYIPSNPRELSLSGTGVASRNNIFLSSSEDSDQSSSIGFSINKWVQGLDGNSIYLRKNNYHFSFASIGTNDIELRDDVPSDEPLNMIGAHLLSAEISRLFLFSEKLNIGIGSNINYHQLFTDKFINLTFHFGCRILISDKLSLAQTIQNISVNNKEIPPLYAIGFSYYASKTKTEALLDYKYSNEYKGGIHLAANQKIGLLAINCGYSKYSNLKTTISAGFNFKITKTTRFLYSILSIQNSNLGLAHSFGIEFSI
tara:strand:+ start:154 stop:984 length:831 start_codon:yes stop_codon:yes gene_type:complete